MESMTCSLEDATLNGLSLTVVQLKLETEEDFDVCGHDSTYPEPCVARFDQPCLRQIKAHHVSRCMAKSGVMA